jgi:hypothetical protein
MALALHEKYVQRGESKLMDFYPHPLAHIFPVYLHFAHNFPEFPSFLRYMVRGCIE